MRVAPDVKLTDGQRAGLLRMSKARSSSTRRRERAQIILLAAEGLQNDEISQRLGQDRKKVGRWRARFTKGGIEAMVKDKSRPGRMAPISTATRSKIIKLTTEEKPDGHTHWSRTTMAKHSALVHRPLVGCGPQPDSNLIGSSPANFLTKSVLKRSSTTLLDCI